MPRLALLGGCGCLAALLGLLLLLGAATALSHPGVLAALAIARLFGGPGGGPTTPGGPWQPHPGQPVGLHAYWPVIQEHATARGLDPRDVAALVLIESGGDPNAVSPQGAMGLMQVMPFHFAPGEDPFDPSTNLRVGTRVLRANLDYCHRAGAPQPLWGAIVKYFGAATDRCEPTGATDALGQTGYGYLAAWLAARDVVAALLGG